MESDPTTPLQMQVQVLQARVLELEAELQTRVSGLEAELRWRRSFFVNDTLDSDCLRHIFRYLLLSDLVHILPRVCKLWHSVVLSMPEVTEARALAERLHSGVDGVNVEIKQQGFWRDSQKDADLLFKTPLLRSTPLWKRTCVELFTGCFSSILKFSTRNLGKTLVISEEEAQGIVLAPWMETLDLSNCNLGEATFAVLLKHIKKFKNLKELDLCCCELTSKSVALLGKALEEGFPAIQSLNLNGNSLDDGPCGRAILEGIKANKSRYTHGSFRFRALAFSFPSPSLYLTKTHTDLS